MAKNDRHFRFKPKNSYLRTLSKREYKSVMHYLRWCAWEIHKKIDFDKVNSHITDTMIYGKSVIMPADLYK